MRVLLVNTSERIGRAAVAAGRVDGLHFKKTVSRLKMLVREKTAPVTPNVVAVGNRFLMQWRFLWERIVVWAANRFRKHHLFAVDIANARE